MRNITYSLKCPFILETIVKMTDSLAKSFACEEFNPDKFVKELSAQCVGADELRKQRARIQELADDTSAQLKRNVYQNYMQFIETAKEISHLESEMYQLSQLLGEQRSLLSTLGSSRSTSRPPGIFDESLESQQLNETHDNTHVSKEEENKQQKQKLVQLLENVEGAMSLVETPGRVCLHEGSLLELDPLDGTPLKRIHAYLFNDVLMIASWLATGGRRGPPRYKMQAVYNLQSLAIVNVRDLASVKLAFKLLAFPDTRVFQCPTAISKKEWLDKCEQTKRAHLNQEQSSGQSSDYSNSNSNLQESTKNKDSTIVLPSRSLSLDSNTPIDDGDESESLEPLPEWLLEVTEDLDSCMAQRHFEEAYSLLEKVKNYLRESQQTANMNDIKSKVEDRGSRLVDILTRELELSAEAKSLQGGGLRSARRAVRLLIQLDRSAQACQLYLQLCNAALKARLKRVKREGATIPYVKQLSAIAFSNIVEMAREFLKLFPESSNCTSSLVVWCSQEVKHLTSHLIKQLFIPQVILGTLVECISTMRAHCDQLTQLGMDLRYQLDGQLRVPLVRALQDAGEKYLDAVKVRAGEDTWRPSNLQNPQNLDKLLSELDDQGIPVPKSCLTGDCWISLTSNTIAFARLYVGLLVDCLSVATPELIYTIDNVLVLVMKAQVQHLVASLNNIKFKQERKLVQDNAVYVRDVIIERGLELYNSTTGQKFNKFIELKQQIVFDPVPASKPKPAPRTSVQKYSTTEYL
ncbi:exocyst complex component 8 [Diachasma alloeum]|uniref:exocyst complex component 8 n=1 Tax=Diachasma alloeum TaxID=454923 RepID=UPI0007382CA2|nr:exocyst complex component 8 [Diachasma alloeum]XP_015123199.1 exocyst complex component 8 [Diachasma alloeum]XP_015123200.1 exocyst complex component 8 [Diachasma alloeum]